MRKVEIGVGDDDRLLIIYDQNMDTQDGERYLAEIRLAFSMGRSSVKRR